MFASTKTYFTGGNPSGFPTLSVAATLTAEGSQCRNVVINSAGTLAYISDDSDGNAYVYSLATNSLVDTIVGGGSRISQINASGTRYYGSFFSNRNIYYIDLATKTKTSSAFSLLSGNVEWFVLKSDTEMFVAQQQGHLTLVNPSAFTVTQSITVPSNALFSAVAKSDFSKIYCPGAYGAKEIYVYSPSLTILNTITTPFNPWYCSLSPDESKLWVSNYSSSSVSIMDTSSETITNTLNVGSNPTQPVFSPDGAYAYISKRAPNKILTIDTATETVLAETDSIPGIFGPNFAISPDGSKIVAASQTEIQFINVT